MSDLRPVTVSSILFAAEWAATERLPATSRQLIEAQDDQFRLWREARWPSPVPADLQAARAAVEADLLAKVVMQLRRQGNEAAAEEYAPAEPQLTPPSCITHVAMPARCTRPAPARQKTRLVLPARTPSATAA